MANLDKGWIRLYRQLTDSTIWNCGAFDKRSAWIDLLLSVNYEQAVIDFNGHPFTIRPGQTLTSISKLAQRWQWSRARVVRYLNTLEQYNMVTRKRIGSGTLLTVENYGKFQGRRNSNVAGNVAGDVAVDVAGDVAQLNKDKKNKEEKEEGRSASQGYVYEEPLVGWNLPDDEWEDA